MDRHNHAPEDDRRGDEQLDRMFDVLSDGHRRRILTMVAEANPREVGEFVRRDPSADGGDREVVRKLMYHVHLPKLAAAGYVEWDRETGTVRRGPAFDEISGLLDLLSAHDDALPDDWP